MSAYPPSRLETLPVRRLVDRPLGIMDDGWQLRLCQHLAGNLLVEQAVKSEKLAGSTLAQVQVAETHLGTLERRFSEAHCNV